MEELRKESRLPPYLVYPRFLVGMDLPDTAKLVYVLLLDRARLSRAKGGRTDEAGFVYVNYTIASMGQAIGKSEMTVKTAYRQLEQAGLIRRQKQGVSHPNRIFLRLPRQTETCPSEGKKMIPEGERKLSGSKNKSKNNPVKDYVWGDYL